MSEIKIIYELLNDLWNVLHETAEEPPEDDEVQWRLLADKLETICGKYARNPRMAAFASGMGACVYNYFCQSLKGENNES